eukprot:4938284-Prorocentrum_lima.AAC.1
MTSSLVGSEMCIRDRAETGKDHLALFFPHHAGKPRQQRSSKQPAPTSGCLLYTSDAADDM